jgi:hypothetical protein
MPTVGITSLTEAEVTSMAQGVSMGEAPAAPAAAFPEEPSGVDAIPPEPETPPEGPAFPDDELPPAPAMGEVGPVTGGPSLGASILGASSEEFIGAPTGGVSVVLAAASVGGGAALWLAAGAASPEIGGDSVSVLPPAQPIRTIVSPAVSSSCA